MNKLQEKLVYAERKMNLAWYCNHKLKYLYYKLKIKYIKNKINKEWRK